jgi:spore germination cell wall hydrolase CwlJ-like protein
MRIFIFLLVFVFSGASQSKEIIYDESDIICLAVAMYHEARGEKYVGMRAVGHAILNRDRNRGFGNLCRTVYQPAHPKGHYSQCSFSFACDNKSDYIKNKKSWNSAYEIAYGLVNGYYPFSSVGEADHYLVCNIRHRIWWTKHMAFITKVGRHCFYNSRNK